MSVERWLFVLSDSEDSLRLESRDAMRFLRSPRWVSNWRTNITLSIKHTIIKSLGEAKL